MKMVTMIKLLLSVAIFHQSFASYIREGEKTAGECFTPSLDNGWVEADSNILGNNFVGKFRCYPGFVLTGEQTVKCRDGVWNSGPEDFPVCAAIGSCNIANVPKIAKNGFQQKNSQSAGKIVRYKCNKGYRLVGPNTAYCTPTGWSVGQAPVCAKAGCDTTQLSGDHMVYGASRSVYGGAVYIFSCSPGSVMEGSSAVFCDGESWNGTKPECLAAPHPPSLSVIINTVQVENPAVAAGQDVTLACTSLGGSPAPSLSFYLNDEKVGEDGNVTATYTFTVGQHHDGVRMSCAAANRVVRNPVSSLYQVLTIKSAPSTTYVKGSATVSPSESAHTQYVCTSAVSDPAADMSVKVSDQKGDNLPVVVKNMPVMKVRKGFTSSISFGILFGEGFEHVVIECRAGNEIGEAISTHNVRVRDPNENVKVKDDTAHVVEDKEESPLKDMTLSHIKTVRAFKENKERKMNKKKTNNGTENNESHHFLYSEDYASSHLKLTKLEGNTNILKINGEMVTIQKETNDMVSKYKIGPTHEQALLNDKEESINSDKSEADLKNDSGTDQFMAKHEAVINDSDNGYHEEMNSIGFGMTMKNSIQEHENVEENVLELGNSGEMTYNKDDKDGISNNKSMIEQKIDRDSEIDQFMVKLEPVTYDYDDEHENEDDTEKEIDLISEKALEHESYTYSSREESEDNLGYDEEYDNNDARREFDEYSAAHKKYSQVEEYNYVGSQDLQPKETSWLHNSENEEKDQANDQESTDENIFLNPTDYDYYDYNSDATEILDSGMPEKGSEIRSLFSEYHYKNLKTNIIEEPTFRRSEFETAHMALKSSNNFDNQAKVSSKTLYTVSS